MNQGVPDPLIGQVLDGRYAITRKLGTGGMGAVYEAEQKNLGRKVAIKTIHAHLASKAIVVERFRREAMAAASAGSQHIVDVYDLGVMPNGAPYMVMELIEGTDLRSLVETEGRLATSTAAHIVRQACDALEAAHEMGIIHRDVKPENIMITKRRNDPAFVKVVDFGISKLRDSSLTGSHELLGTPYAMAPEQLRGAGHVDARCDVYGLGVCLYYALCAGIPYEADTLPLLIAQISAGERVDLRSRVSHLPASAYDLVDTATAHDPAKRFRSMSAFAAALRTLENAAPDASLAPTAHVAPRAAPLAEPKAHAAREVHAEPKTHATMLAAHARETTAPGRDRLPTTFGSKIFRFLVAVLLLGGVGAGAYFGLEAWRGARSAVSLDAGVAALDAVELTADVGTARSQIHVTGLPGAVVHAGARSCTTPCSIALPAGARRVRVVLGEHTLPVTIDAEEERTLALGAARFDAERARVTVGDHRCEGPCVVPLEAGRYTANAARDSSHASSTFDVREGEITTVMLMLMDDGVAEGRAHAEMDASDMHATGRVRFPLLGDPIALSVAGRHCNTPCTLELPVGEHTVLASRDGRTTRHPIIVRPGPTVVTGINPPARMTMSGSSIATGRLILTGRALRVQIAGQSCTTPCQLDLPPGRHNALISYANGITTTRVVTIRAGDTVRISVAANMMTMGARIEDLLNMALNTN